MSNNEQLRCPPMIQRVAQRAQQSFQSAFAPTLCRLRGLIYSPQMAAVNLLMLAATILLVLLSERSVLTGLCILGWGAGACCLAWRAGLEQRPGWTTLWVVFAYACGTLVLFVMLNGLYHLTGI